MSEKISLADIRRLRELAKEQATKPSQPAMFYINGEWVEV